MLTDTQTQIDLTVLGADHASSSIGESITCFIVAKQQAMDAFWSREADAPAKAVAGLVVAGLLGASVYILWLV
jgi:hypothetical protein